MESFPWGPTYGQNVSPSRRVVQWAGCMWYLLAKACKFDLGAENNWIDADMENKHTSFQNYAANSSMFSQTAQSMVGYLRAVYWVLVGASTIGYGDITATNVYETVFSTFTILFGGLLKPAIVGSIASLLSANLLKRDERASAVKRGKFQTAAADLQTTTSNVSQLHEGSLQGANEWIYFFDASGAYERVLHANSQAYFGAVAFVARQAIR